MKKLQFKTIDFVYRYNNTFWNSIICSIILALCSDLQIMCFVWLKPVTLLLCFSTLTFLSRVFQFNQCCQSANSAASEYTILIILFYLWLNVIIISCPKQLYDLIRLSTYWVEISTSVRTITVSPDVIATVAAT